MFAGMGILTAVLGMPHSSPIEIQALFMAATMTVPMVAWMLIRGHSRRGSAEMGAAMVVPLAVLFPMLWTGIIGSHAILDLQHLLMLPPCSARWSIAAPSTACSWRGRLTGSRRGIYTG